ncbi:restriction endonuclease subunit S [Acinetobacter lwoffii]|jgi:type I restriction enzyme S subunit|uniref:restriction endonuclease subunit S n=1 Tax=Acinetobacter lwoffii TaxID=28090 RepID=UPI000A320E38|nr:restriction endonuclease subunit S [Acinetobacter lwoffii]
MSLDNLPVEWCLIQLGHIVNVNSGVGFPKEFQGRTDQPIPVYKVSDVSYSVLNQNGMLQTANNSVSQGDLDKLKGHLFNEGSTLFAKIGEAVKLNRRAYVKRKGLADNNVMGVTPLENVSNKYIFYFLHTIDLALHSRSTTIPSIRKSDIEELPISFPALAEQQEIVRQLDIMLAQVEQIKARLDAIPAILKKFRQSVLADAVSGKLTEEWRNNQADISSWTFGELREFIEKPIYGTSAKSSKSGEVPVLRMGNLQNGEIDWSDLVYTSDATEIKKYDLKLNDLLFNRTNSPELVGKTSIYRGNRDAVFAGYLIRVRCLPSLDPEFLNYHLNSHIGREYCYRVKTDGVSQSNINAQKLLAYPLNCPPVNEQKIIVKLVKQYLELIHRIEEIIRSAQKRVNLLTQSILGKAFSGELTAEWRQQHQELITGINSAESLLAAIQAEREASKPVKKVKKVK